jgi:hypothetical protein
LSKDVHVVSPAAHTGGPADVSRRAKLETLSRPEFMHYADEVWPRGRHPIFQPEPGCSEPTFIGAAADVASLAGMMLNAIAVEVAKPSTEASAAFFTSRGRPEDCHVSLGAGPYQ